jgi:hypothetical protein
MCAGFPRGQCVGDYLCWAVLWSAVRVLDMLESGGEAKKLEGRG